MNAVEALTKRLSLASLEVRLALTEPQAIHAARG